MKWPAAPIVMSESPAIQITGINGSIEVSVPFKGVLTLDEACNQVYRQLAQWGAEVAGVARNAAGES